MLYPVQIWVCVILMQQQNETARPSCIVASSSDSQNAKLMHGNQMTASIASYNYILMLKMHTISTQSNYSVLSRSGRVR